MAGFVQLSLLGLSLGSILARAIDTGGVVIKGACKARPGSATVQGPPVRTLVLASLVRTKYGHGSGIASPSPIAKSNVRTRGGVVT
jgi:hypothetical protein